ncbi:MAG: hypothetical protein U9Q03_06140 [Patescibacteria group bacterium]|nr:hypothetical protein [Patescibacteria group bacterium]
METVVPLLWVVSVCLVAFLVVKTVTIVRSGKRVSWENEVSAINSDILRCVDSSNKEQATLLLRRLRFMLEKHEVDVPGVNLELLKMLVDNVEAKAPRRKDTTQPKKEPDPAEVDAEIEFDLNELTEGSKLADVQLRNDLRLTRDRLRKAMQLTLGLRREQLDIQSVIERLLKQLDE